MQLRTLPDRTSILPDNERAADVTDRKFNIAVAGATGLVGETMLSILEERRFPVDKIAVLASANSAGKRIRWRNRQLSVTDVAGFDFAGVDIALFSAGRDVSGKYAPVAAAAGAVVIDNTSEFRYDDDVPLVVPEVNKGRVAEYKTRNIVANPNCSTIQLVVALKPIFDAAGIERVNVATYQAVSGAGRASVETLAGQTAALMNGRPVKVENKEPQLAFNVVPSIDSMQDNGYTREEMKIVWETRKILDAPELPVNATAVRVPVFFGHSEAVHLETREKLTVAQVRKLLAAAPGVTVADGDGKNGAGIPTAAGTAVNRDTVFVGRIREDISHPRGIDMWVVADNVRKGAALNSVQIAEILVKNYF